jgi:K+-sensing histidine kinase KdpD
MDAVPFVRTRWFVILCSALAPLLAAAILSSISGVTLTTAALVLVVCVVAAGASGDRVAGVVAAVSAGAWFDFFFTPPIRSFKVINSDDVQATVLLLVVGIAVSEIAQWGRRQQARSSRRAGYLDGVLGAADVVAQSSSSPTELVDYARRQIVEVLGIDRCTFEPAGANVSSVTSLNHDGTVTRRGARLDVDRDGLPTDDLVTLDASHRGVSHGRFVLTASTRVARPTLEQRRVAVLLADQVGASLALDGAQPRPVTS